MTKNIKITVEIDGSEITREYAIEKPEEFTWDKQIHSMIETIENSNEPF